jgi:hypothetical protein
VNEYLNSSGVLKGDPGGNGFVTWDTGVKSFAFGPSFTGDGQANLYFLQNNGYLWRYDGGYYEVDSGVKSFALDTRAGNNYLIDLTNSGILKTSTGNGFNDIATEVQSFVVDASGNIDALFVGGALKDWNGSNWTLL